MERNEETRGIFRKESLDELDRPEDLDVYVMAVRPPMVALALALLIVTACCLVWFCKGTIPLTVTINGMVADREEVVAYLPVADYRAGLSGNPVRILWEGGDSAHGTIVAVSDHPYSREELSSQLSSDWMRASLATRPFLYEVRIRTDGPIDAGVGSLCEATVLVATRHPADYLVGRT